MVSPFTPTSGFLSLPYDLRRSIYDRLVESEDTTPLMQTCRQLRRDVWSCLPGGSKINYARPETKEELRFQVEIIHETIEVSRIEFIAEPWYSSGSALKVRVTWRHRDSAYSFTTSTWTIRDISSPMAGIVCLYATERVTVVFEPATRGNLQAGLLILRAKVFDIVQLMQHIICRPGQETFDVDIVFRGGKPESRPKSTRKSFWEMRPRRIAEPSKDTDVFRHYSPAVRPNYQGREAYPFFYECLMLPFFSCHSWLPEKVCFDLEPARKHTSFVSTRPNVPKKYLGWQELVRAEQMWRTKARPGDPDWRQIYHIEDMIRVRTRMANFHMNTGLFLSETAGDEAGQLRSYLRRMRVSKSPTNPFAKDGFRYTAVSKIHLSFGGKAFYKPRDVGFYDGSFPGGELRARLLRWAGIDR